MAEGTNITFGPVFNKTILYEILKLQEGIKGIFTENNYTIDDICYAPLLGNEPKSSSKCLIQSILGYWRDDLNDFMGEDEPGMQNMGYLDRVKICTK